MVVCRLFLLFLIQMIFQPCWNKPQSATIEMTPLSLHEKEAIVNSHVEFLKHIFNHFRQTDYLYRWNMENKDNLEKLLIQAAKNTTKDEDALLEKRLQVIETKLRDLTSNTTKDRDAALEERLPVMDNQLRDVTSNTTKDEDAALEKRLQVIDTKVRHLTFIENCSKDGYEYFEDIDWCIQISNTTENFETAWRSCAANGGTLAIVDTKEKQVALSNLANKTDINYVLIGLSDTLNEGKYVWNDGTPVTFTSWKNGEPYAGYNCAYLSRYYNYDWFTYRCDHVVNYACEKREKKPAVCPQGYTYFKKVNWCVKPSTTKRRWEEVSEACVAEGGTFAVVNTAEKHEAISDMMRTQNITALLIGLHDIMENGEYRWADGTPVSFTRWGNGEPDEKGANVNCVRYSSSLDYKWKGDDCYSDFQFLCEMKMT